MRKKSLIILALIMCLTGCAHASGQIDLVDVSSGEMSADSSSTEAPESDVAAALSTAESEPKVIVVYVCGAVNKPGVYELLEDSRINDAVLAAGGFSDGADTTYVNLAAPLSDGVKLIIPTLEETSKAAAGSNSADSAAASLPDSFDIEPLPDNESATGGLININTASAEELKSLPGIGEKVAGRIIEYRDKNGRFDKIEDIMKISGIKDKLFSRIKDKITV